jgi:hypothetical protein
LPGASKDLRGFTYLLALNGHARITTFLQPWYVHTEPVTSFDPPSWSAFSARRVF